LTCLSGSPFLFSPLFSLSSRYAYGQSKLANVLFSLELATRTQAVGISSNSLHPGAIQTDLLRHVETALSSAGTYVGSETLSQLLLAIKDIGLNLVAMTADQGAYTQLLVATSPELQKVSGKYFIPVGKQTLPSLHGQSGRLGRRLWKESAIITAKWKAEHPELL
jgi:NAD(P)-dependent dehydrogenase (short-subunit alcohol dehydrogenase family)